MKDHAFPSQRLATGTPVVNIVQPGWIQELLIVLSVVLVIAWCVTAVQLTVSKAETKHVAGERDFWQELALTPERVPAVRLERDGAGFKCVHFHIRREWEQAVAAQCQVLGSMLITARATP